MIAAAARLDAGLIARALAGRAGLHLCERVDSTSDEVRRVARTSDADRLIVVATAQDAGRGRRGRTWHSPPGGGVYLSLLAHPAGPPAALTRWTLAAGVAVCRALRACGLHGAALEWPNDIVWDGRKLGGVLAEARSQGSEIADLVLGVGVNVVPLGADADPALRRRATSIVEALQPTQAPPRDQVVAAIAVALVDVADELDGGGWPALAEAWLATALDAPGRRVEVAGAAGRRPATTTGLDPDGALRVRYDDGQDAVVRLAGSVRPLEG